MDEDDLPQGETITLDIEDTGVTDTEDGGALVTLDDEDEGRQRSSDFYSNLAEEMPESELDELATRFLDLIAQDKQDRKERDRQYEMGLRRTGLGNDAPGGAQFDGASRVVHPMLVSATVDFAARLMKELFPPGGPVKDLIPGDLTPEKVRKARRKAAMMNWQLTVQSTEFRAELEQTLTQVPMGGAQYLKLGWDEPRNRPTGLFVAIDDMLLPYAATSFYSAQRRTHVQYLTTLDFRQRIRSGDFRDVDLAPSSLTPDQTSAARANDKIEGRDPSTMNVDGLRKVYEVYALCSLSVDVAGVSTSDRDEDIAPYIITIDDTSRKVLSIYRNWDELDDSREELHWFAEFPFVPWRGAYPLGLPHMIGTLSGAATGALRALLDSAHIQNTASGVKLKGLTRGGQSLQPQVGEVVEIEGGINTDDIRKLFMPMPFNPPSPMLLQLLDFLVNTSNNVVRTTFEDMAEQRSDAPVGTTLARLEQAMVVYRAIHARLHDGMARVLRILHRLNGMYLDDEDTEREVGEELATRADFEGPMDVVPVSDPNIFSEAQRVAQAQAVAQRADLKPQLYNQRAVEVRIMETLKVPNPDQLLMPAVEPKEQNAVNENVTATLGRPVTAFPEQDHIAHLQTHMAYMMSPAFGMSPLIAPSYLPVMLGHIKEHLAWWYASQVFETANQAIDGDVGEEMRKLKGDIPARKALDRMLAEAALVAVEQGQQQFSQLPQVVQQAQQLLQQLSPQPQDPKALIEQGKLALKGQELQQDGKQNTEDNEVKMALERMRQEGEDRRKAAELETKVAVNVQDNTTAIQLATAEIESGEKIAQTNGTGTNPNPNP